MEQIKVTPMMEQYLRIKERYRDAILFFRLGDFYEMFFEDAQTASRILDIALTARSKSQDQRVPLCGVPYHSAEPYIQKLLSAGHKVAVCEQVEDPKSAKGVVQREVVRVITPGTVTAAEALDARGNNFLAAVCRDGDRYGLAFSDITTGEFRVTEVSDDLSLADELDRMRASEILVPGDDVRLVERLRKRFAATHLTRAAPGSFSCEPTRRFDLPESARGCPAGLRAGGAILGYLENNAPESLKLLRKIEVYAASHYLVLDEATRANLELVASFQGDRSGSLLGVLDRTLTPMGARRLRQWLLYPLLDEAEIRARHESVQELLEDFGLREDLRAALRQMQDLERLAGRSAAGTATPKDLVALKQTLSAARTLRARLSGASADCLVSALERLTDPPELIDLIERAVVDDPPFSLSDGGYIRNGFDAELDDIRGARVNAKQWIAAFEAAEKKRTGIPSLKVRYNRVFGYYIEVTNTHLKSVPADYLRKQTLANGERYFTPELKEYEAKVLNADALIGKLEAVLLAGVRERVALCYPHLKVMAAALAELDALVSLAQVADSHHFTRPQVDSHAALSIREGRHPVVENAVGRGAFVPNDCRMDPDSAQILLLTGPNMAGKSTYMRQVALIVILAQMGSFVPASQARIGVADRIFTRIGAADSLARGESTFMVEMKETANILRHATRRSLVLLDEVGRGTSTYDGISIAWAVAECLHDAPERPRTLFATHYHELTQLAQSRPRLRNYNFAVKEWQGEIIFLRSLTEGAASHSYGIHVARLAGLPRSVIERAKEVLAQLERSGSERENFGFAAVASGPSQMALFVPSERRVWQELRGLDVTKLTPLEALNRLHRLCEEARK